MSTVRITYSGATPGADTNVYELFSTVKDGFGGNFLAIADIDRLFVDIDHPQALVLRLSRSADRGATWTTIYETASIAAPAAGASTQYDFHVSQYKDVKLEVVNGGSAQTGWTVDISLHCGHSSAA
jgi:hypothetical protein